MGGGRVWVTTISPSQSRGILDLHIGLVMFCQKAQLKNKKDQIIMINK